MKRIAAIFIMLVLLCTASAEVVQPNDDFWYLDEANVLSEATEGEIFFANQRLYDACGAEFVVVAVDSTDGMAIDDYAYSLFNEWEIGGNTYRGLLLLMAIKDDNYYAMPGTNMSMYFDSATIKELLDTYLEPDFAKKNYDSGAQKFFEAAYEKIVDDLNLDLSIADAKADYEAFMRSESGNQQETAAKVTQPAYDYEQSVPAGHRRSSAAPVLIAMILALFIIGRSFRRAPRSTHRSSAGSMLTGFLLGRMTSSRNRYPGSRPMFGGFHVNHRSHVRPSGGVHHRPNVNSFGGGFSGRSSGGFGGAQRKSGGFGGSTRSSGGGFGGASRSGGASRGPSTRGGGSGRFSR